MIRSWRVDIFIHSPKAQHISPTSNKPRKYPSILGSKRVLNFENINKLRPAATRNAQRCVPNADPQRKGPKWVSSSADGVDAFSPGRKKHPKEPYVLKGHVTSSHGPYWSTDWHGLDASPWGWCCYSNCTCTNDHLHFFPTRVRCLLQGFKKANNHTVQVWQPYRLYRANKLNQMLFLPGRKKQKLGRIRITQMLFSGVKKSI